MVGILQDETDPMVSVMKVRQCVRVCIRHAYTCCTHAGHVSRALLMGMCKCLRKYRWSALRSTEGFSALRSVVAQRAGL